MRTRVKFCGMTRPQDAKKAVELGVDAIGIVFYPGSPRYLPIKQAQEIAKVIPAFITVVGVFVDADKKDVERAFYEVPLNLLQFQGNESEEYCESFGKPYIKVFRLGKDNVHDQAYFNQIHSNFPNMKAILLDSYHIKHHGGTGQIFDWSLIPPNLDRPIILAGGLSPQNINKAITEVRPYAVDVSSGIEAEKGIKDHHKMITFIQEVNRANKI